LRLVKSQQQQAIVGAIDNFIAIEIFDTAGAITSF
jgi:hypothetical protein